MDLIIASNNAAKVREIKQMVQERKLPLCVRSLKDAGICIDVDETGTTFEENARIKAEAIRDLMIEKGQQDNTLIMADDSGLCVDALDGAPGVFSARYGGEGMTDIQRYQKLLGALDNTPEGKRTARFVCSICLIYPVTQKTNCPVTLFNGICEGIIARGPSGDNGFGYDPIFYLPQFQKTMAELSSVEKNEISHRGNAIRLMLQELCVKMEDNAQI